MSLTDSSYPYCEHRSQSQLCAIQFTPGLRLCILLAHTFVKQIQTFLFFNILLIGISDLMLSSVIAMVHPLQNFMT